MKITKEQFKGIVREVMIDESEYQEFFKRALEKAGKSIPDMSDEEKKAFFNKIDAAWDAKGEKNEELTGNQHKLDVDGDGEIEASDLAALRAGKTNEAMASGPWVGLEKTPKGPKLVKTFKSGNEAKAWVMKSPGGHSIMTKKQWDVSEGKSVNEAVSSSDMAKIKGAVESASSFMGLGAELKKLGMKYTFATEPLPIYIIQPTPNNRVAVVNKKYASKPDFVVGDIAVGIMEGTSVNEASKKPTIKVVNKLKNEQGIQIVVVKTTKGETMYGGFVVRGKLQKVIPVGANNSKESVQKRALQIWDEFGKQLGESVNEAENSKFPSWPPVLDKFNTKEIHKLEADYKASLDKSSALLKKQWELINKGYPSDFPWENYDKWPAKLKAEVEKLNSQIEKEREKHPAMFKKLMQARGTWR